MNRSHVFVLLVGFGLGAAITSAIFLSNRPAPIAPAREVASTAAPSGKAPSIKPAAPEPARTIQAGAAEPVTSPAPSSAKVESAPAPAATAPPAPEKPAFDFKTAFVEVARKGIAAYRSKEMQELTDRIKASGTNGVRTVIEQLQDSTSTQDRFLLVALLESLGDPAALPALDTILKNDSDLLVRRMAAHAAALIGSDAAMDVLRPAMANDQDWGVRVNSAYGLAKLKQQDGLDTLQQFYTSPDTPAEYRLAILGGLADVAAPTTGPLFRQILADTTDPGYVLIAIGALEKMKDAQALPTLQRIAASAKSETIRQAAQRAIDSISK